MRPNPAQRKRLARIGCRTTTQLMELTVGLGSGVGLVDLPINVKLREGRPHDLQMPDALLKICI
jgi:hypothetical protein